MIASKSHLSINDKENTSNVGKKPLNQIKSFSNLLSCNPL